MDAETATPHLRAVLHHQRRGPRDRSRTGHGYAASFQSGGSIEVDTEPGGTTFRVRLPEVAAVEGTASEEVAPKRASTASRQCCSSKTTNACARLVRHPEEGGYRVPKRSTRKRRPDLVGAPGPDRSVADRCGDARAQRPRARRAGRPAPAVHPRAVYVGLLERRRDDARRSHHRRTVHPEAVHDRRAEHEVRDVLAKV